MKTFACKQLLSVGAELGEGPLWNESEQKLYWVNINPGELHRFDPITKNDEVFSVGEPIGTVAFCEDGTLIAALKSGIYSLSIADNSVIKTFIVNPEPETPNRFNDGKCDPYGRFLAGTCYTPAEPKDIMGGFYSVENGKTRILLDNIAISNGLAFSRNNKKLYYIDSLKRVVHSYDYDKCGNLSNEDIVYVLPKEEGILDGMTIDTNGNLWIALFTGGKVICVDPVKKERIAEIIVPASKVTCPTFGGKDYKTLFITTAWEGNTPDERKADPLAGDLFYADVDAQGYPSFLYKK